jgi:hypothetical protein
MANLALPGILEKVLYDSFVFVPPRNPIIDDFLVCLFVCLFACLFLPQYLMILSHTDDWEG